MEKHDGIPCNTNDSNGHSGRNDGTAHQCWYCGHNGGDPIKTAKIRQQGQFFMTMSAILLSLAIIKAR